MKKICLALSILAVLIIASCSPSDSSSDDDNYSRSALLINWADNIIVPAFTDYLSKNQQLTAKTAAFTSAPTTASLQEARAAWLEAYKAFQGVGLYNIAKAEEIYFRETANTYPVDVAGIEANVSSGNYDLSAISQFSKQGFPALDYLLNGVASSDAEIIAMYTSNPAAQSYKTYLDAVAAKLQQSADLVLTDWNSGYRDTFVSNTGNTVSGSVNKMTNNLVKYFEKDIRAAKVGIPAGVFSNGATFPEKVEAYYKNDVSKILLNASLQATQDFFNGKHFNGSATGESLKSYLDFVGAVRNGQNLSDIINGQFVVIQTSVTQLGNSFSQQVITDNSKMISTYDALQQNVIYFKLDMMQALNITIDYVDSDGD